MAETELQPANPEEEIKKLERLLEEKKRALVESGAEQQPEKETFREVVKEHIEDVRASVAGEKAAFAPPAAKPDGYQKTLKGELEEDVRILVEIALTKSIAEAVRVAERAESPYLLDELHDHLVDDYYDKLVSLRKV